MRNQTVLISGASIAGPALAYWLQRYGFAVTVVERAPELRRGGQAVDFTGETHHDVLRRMGILDDIYAHRTGTTDVVYVDESGKQLAVMSGEFTGGDVEILRGDLSRIMYEKTYESCEYIFGDSISALTETDDGVWVEFENGAPRQFDLVFGADGIHSRVRRLTFGPEKDYVKHLGHYYCIAGSSPWLSRPAGERSRATSYGYNVPGRVAISGGSKAHQFYVFAAPELDYPRGDVDAQRQIIKDTFAGMGWKVPQMLTELDGFDDVYLDSVARVRKMKSYTRGRIALVGDAGYGNTLGGFGTGQAVVGAYIIAGELAVAGGDHTVAFDRYNEIMRGYTKMSEQSSAGRFFAPKTARGIKIRNWFLGSKAMDLMMKMAEKQKNLDLPDYPALVAAN
ncbi:FAD-dependent monooxygenase [Nocardia arthritidis]|uniref:FAD-dependent oxidoreductase n=1 Tax=Nocardia arthritidis TaxID=228602 RepID=A0A6G9YQC4_9NOCA|nr:FAD-dependent monooxygenase [Nocardia arthritidis]QIS15499.1 FAD-dependent oxidoreductase [Nocardia arthritidis]